MAEINETKASAEETEAQLTAELKRRRSWRDAQDDVPASAVTRSQPGRMEKAFEHARICARIADDHRAKDILVLDLRGATPLVDFFVIATANSRRQGNAIASEIDQEMKRLSEHKLGLEGSEEGRWTLIDYGDFVVHVFSGEARAYYALEEIWGDAPRLGWQDPDRVRPGRRTEPVKDRVSLLDEEEESEPEIPVDLDPEPDA